MLAIRELTDQELALVAGGWFLSSDSYATSGSWTGSTTSPFDVTLGSSPSGWTFGVSYDHGQFGVWTQDPSGTQAYHVFGNGDVDGSITFPFDGGQGSVTLGGGNAGGGNVNVTIGWKWE